MAKAFLALILVSLTLFAAQANAELQPLPVDQAYKFSVKTTKTDSIIAKWNIAPGYYLYKKRFQFTVKSPEGAMLGKINMPKGIEKQIPTLGPDEVYKHSIDIAIPVMNPTNEKMSLLVTYQGCASFGFCYPPTTKLVSLDTTPGLFSRAVEIQNYQASTATKTVDKGPPAQTLSEQDQATTLLMSSHTALALLIFFGFGLLLTFTPCVLPMIPILSGIIVGHGKQLSTKKAFMLSLAYVAGMSVTYAIAGVFIGLAGGSVQAAMQTPFVIILFSLVFVLLALSLFDFYELRLPKGLQERIAKLSNSQQGGSYIGAVIMGSLSTLIVSPCVTAPLVGALAYIANTGNALFGGSALFMLGLGMGVPLLVIGTAHGSLLPKAGPWMNIVKQVFGVMLLGLAVWMLDRLLPGQITLFLWASLLIMSAIYMGALSATPESGWGKFWKGSGIIFLTYGVLMVIGTGMGNTNPFKPLSFPYPTMTTVPVLNTLAFKRVKSVADVERELAQAKSQGKRVMLDFYADWCVTCKEIAHAVFNQPTVIAMLNNAILLQADVTANDKVDKALERHFNVIAPPTMLFFDKQGKEIANKRIVGSISKQTFIENWRK